MDKRGLTHCVISSPDIKKSPIIPLVNVPNYIKKNTTVSSINSSKKKPSNMPQLKTHMKLQTKDKESTT